MPPGIKDSGDLEDSKKEKPVTNQFKKMFLKNPNFNRDTKAQFIMEHGRAGEDQEEAA